MNKLKLLERGFKMIKAKNMLYEHTGKIGTRHYCLTGSDNPHVGFSPGLCGSPLLSNNYAERCEFEKYDCKECAEVIEKNNLQHLVPKA
jgi:hypothetical protein